MIVLNTLITDLNWLHLVLVLISRSSLNRFLSLVSLYCIQLLLSLATWSRASMLSHPPILYQCSRSDLGEAWSVGVHHGQC